MKAFHRLEPDLCSGDTSRLQGALPSAAFLQAASDREIQTSVGGLINSPSCLYPLSVPVALIPSDMAPCGSQDVTYIIIN